MKSFKIIFYLPLVILGNGLVDNCIAATSELLHRDDDAFFAASNTQLRALTVQTVTEGDEDKVKISVEANSADGSRGYRVFYPDVAFVQWVPDDAARGARRCVTWSLSVPGRRGVLSPADLAVADQAEVVFPQRYPYTGPNTTEEDGAGAAGDWLTRFRVTRYTRRDGSVLESERTPLYQYREVARSEPAEFYRAPDGQSMQLERLVNEQGALLEGVLRVCVDERSGGGTTKPLQFKVGEPTTIHTIVTYAVFNTVRTSYRRELNGADERVLSGPTIVGTEKRVKKEDNVRKESKVACMAHYKGGR